MVWADGPVPGRVMPNWLATPNTSISQFGSAFCETPQTLLWARESAQGRFRRESLERRSTAVRGRTAAQAMNMVDWSVASP